MSRAQECAGSTQFVWISEPPCGDHVLTLRADLGGTCAKLRRKPVESVLTAAGIGFVLSKLFR